MKTMFAHAYATNFTYVIGSPTPNINMVSM